MQPISIISCKGCAPDRWTIIGRSKFGAIYKCLACKQLTDLLLRRN